MGYCIMSKYLENITCCKSFKDGLLIKKVISCLAVLKISEWEMWSLVF